MKNKDKKKIAKVSWMPFWWGNKFNKRLSSKECGNRKRKTRMVLKNDKKKFIKRKGKLRI